MRSAIVLALLTVLALAVRLQGIDFGMPCLREADPYIAVHVRDLRQGKPTHDRWLSSTIYPHLVARVATATPLTSRVEHPRTLEQHLAAASTTFVDVRTAVALLAVLIVPGTWLLARRFLSSSWALAAAAAPALSLLHVNFSQQARPHAAAGAMSLLAVVAALRLRRSPTTGSYLLAGIAAALAIGCLQSGVAVLLPLAAAHLLREGAPVGWRRLWNPRVLLTALCIAAAIPLFYSFLFDTELRTLIQEEGNYHDVRASNFDGRGLRVVLRTLWYYEPALLVSVVVALATWIFVRRPPATQPARANRGDLLVVLAYAVPYLVAISLYAETYERFVIPLLPYLACFGAWGASTIVSRLRVGPGRAFATACFVALLAASGVAAVRLSWLRSQPDTLERAASWVLANVDPATEKLVLQPGIDLPLFRTAESMNGTKRRKPVLFTEWATYQSTLPDDARIPPLYDVEMLENSREFGDIGQPDNMRAYLESHGPGIYMVDLLEQREGPVRKLLRDTLAQLAPRVARFSPDERDLPLHEQDEAVDDWPNVTWRILHADCVGPAVEVFRVE